MQKFARFSLASLSLLCLCHTHQHSGVGRLLRRWVRRLRLWRRLWVPDLLWTLPPLRITATATATATATDTTRPMYPGPCTYRARSTCREPTPRTDRDTTATGATATGAMDIDTEATGIDTQATGIAREAMDIAPGAMGIAPGAMGIAAGSMGAQNGWATAACRVGRGERRRAARPVAPCLRVTSGRAPRAHGAIAFRGKARRE